MPPAPFGLTRRPFRPTPDPACFFPSATHAAARNDLIESADRGDGIALLDGEPGTGKTLVALKVLDELPAEARRVLLPGGRFAAPADLFRAFLFDLGKPYENKAEPDLRLAVTDDLLAARESGRRTVVVIDEAHHLSPDLLEELRLVDNLESRTGKAAFTLLVGLPAVREKLSGSLGQRIVARPRVEPLTEAESIAYLHFRLAEAGARPSVLTDEAAEILASTAGGIPRVLNQVGSAAVAAAVASGESCVDAEAALAALERLGRAAPPAESAEPTRPAKSQPGSPPTVLGRGHPAAARPPKQPTPKRRSA
ncbi:MAG TPA: AAA family ATPase [Fimbriiglobus sp.]|jgi:general secretion pathway protein A